MNTPDDESRDLVARAQAGEATAFERLAEQHAARLWRCALALSRDRHRAEDLVQETLVESWRSLARFDDRHGTFSGWMLGILRHRFLKGRRRRDVAGISTSYGLDQAPCPDRPPDRSAEKSEDDMRIQRALADLPEEHRLVVELRFFAGASLEEIATTLGCPLGTVKSRLHHALNKLRQINLSVNLFTSNRE